MKAIVVYHYFAHYRRAVLEGLSKSEIIDFRFVSGNVNDGSGIEPCDMSFTDKSIFVKNRWLFGFLFQFGVLRIALFGHHDATIYLGDPRFITTWLGALIDRLRGRKVYFWTHGWTRRDRGLKRIVRNAFYSVANGLLLYGRRAKEIGLESGFSDDQLAVIYNSLDYQSQRRTSMEVNPCDIAEARSSLFPKSVELPIVICVSRINKQRKLDLLLEAAVINRCKGKPINILLVGEGPELVQLKRKAGELLLNLACTGACYDEKELAVYYSISSVTVSPGMVGLTAMQSLAFGTPVITHGFLDDQMPEVEAIDASVNGSLFEIGNVSDLAREIEYWTYERVDRETLRSVCPDSLVGRYTPESQVNRIENILTR